MHHGSYQGTRKGGKFVKFLTIRKTAATGIMSEHYLRLLVAQGKCPGIRAGNRFLINIEALAEQLDAESRKAVRDKERTRSNVAAFERAAEPKAKNHESPDSSLKSTTPTSPGQVVHMDGRR